MRTCNKCHEVKDESEFSRDRTRADGLAYVCKACANAYAKTKLQSRRRYKDTNPEKVRESARKYSARNAQKRSDYARQYNAENQDIYLAAKALQKAIRDKIMPPARQCQCADCGKQATHYHHDSYAEQDRLKVVALCSSCHKKRHMSSKV